MHRAIFYIGTKSLLKLNRITPPKLPTLLNQNGREWGL